MRAEARIREELFKSRRPFRKLPLAVPKELILGRTGTVLRLDLVCLDGLCKVIQDIRVEPSEAADKVVALFTTD